MLTFVSFLVISISAIVSKEKDLFMDEAQIFSGLKGGDKKAFDLLYDLLYEHVCFFVEKIIKDETEAQDIAIHSLAKFWEKGAEDFETFNQVKTFIFTTARNASFDFLRKVRMQRTHHRNLSYITSDTEESIAERADIALYRVERLQYLIEQIENLPEQSRETFKMVFIDKMPRPLVAEKLNISLSTVNSHCANAKNRLRQVFSEKELLALLPLLGLCLN